ncbi:seven transmembrane protein 1-like isoform X1 [Vicia villosa]|uniref:seven transmembrane protein 1-like isoform X1 n=1 Tax=Vicia villosa TaxID=3911 RepID=UPI00273B7F86|nr:seven transmembrane protein 1-like isoform X1 [Vicia villosa]
MAPSYCVNENKECVKWVETYFKDCLCDMRDDISFSLGVMSLVLWGVAEIPQIITIFRNKSNHGISLAFLVTWVAGDICNLAGCLLEPATLPTQFYTAMLYATTTFILLLQSLYYDHILTWCKRRQIKTNEEDKRLLKPKPSANKFIHDSSSDDDEESSQVASKIATNKPWSIPCSIDKCYGTFLATSIILPLKGNAMRITGIKLFQESEIHSTYGQSLGWIMAAIYTCSRIPQIRLNIKRGSVEGLNPFMFVFALIANASYVGSILVRTTELKSLKANMPWMLDATICVALDIFIISQYIYYRYFRGREASSDDEEYLLK